MSPTIEWLLLLAGGLLIISILASKLSGLLGVPALVVFLAIGMLAGSDGVGGIYFDNARLAQAVGVAAMAFILFSGGLDTPISRVRPVLGAGLALASLGVVLTSVLAGRDKLLISWVGLRGAAPIILATFPLLAGLPQAPLIFNVVFFVVLTSVLLQGTTIPIVARWLRLNAPEPARVALSLREHISEHLLEITLPDGAAAAGQRIIDLHLPRDVLLVLIERDGGHIVPTGSTELLAGDSVLVATRHDQDPTQIRQLLI